MRIVFFAMKTKALPSMFVLVIDDSEKENEKICEWLQVYDYQ